MNIDLDSSLRLSRLSAADAVAAGDAPSKKGVKDALRLEGTALTVTEQERLPPGAGEMEDDDLRRDDALGKLVVSAFDFQPPEMPAFV
ncbi:MAG: hypothetical protein IKC80_06340 [Kiritimatiellae bacterium]|nr:hypothetical protein [Kiritimatiellia bacterium]